jgi:hypothetical protein
VSVIMRRPGFGERKHAPALGSFGATSRFAVLTRPEKRHWPGCKSTCVRHEATQFSSAVIQGEILSFFFSVGVPTCMIESNWEGILICRIERHGQGATTKARSRKRRRSAI